MVKGSIADRILECIGYPESWTKQEVEDNKRIIQEDFSKIDSHVVKAVVSRLCDKIEETRIGSSGKTGKGEESWNSTAYMDGTKCSKYSLDL